MNTNKWSNKDDSSKAIDLLREKQKVAEQRKLERQQNDELVKNFKRTSTLINQMTKVSIFLVIP